MRHDILSDTLFVLNNAESIGKSSCIVPASNLVKNVLSVIQKEGYIGSFDFTDERKEHYRVELVGRVNRARTIKPRFSVKKDDYEIWETRFLPAKDFGILIVSTSMGVMNQKEAAEKNLGGKLLAFIY
jgi:small subunit ribosomal protein S8